MITIRGVVCATDIEIPARGALRYAFFLAESFHATLDVVHVFTPSGLQRSTTYVRREQRIQDLLGEQRLHERLDVVIRNMPAEVRGRATTHILDGALVPAVGGYAERRRSNLIVLGSKIEPGSNPPGSDALAGTQGTIATRLGRAAVCPVLTVPEPARSSVPKIRRVLLPLTGSPSFALGVQWAATFARQFDAVVELLHASGGRPAAPGEELRHRAPEAADALRRAGVAVEHTESASSGDLGLCTLERIDHGHCDLIVLTAQPGHGRPRAEDMVAEIRRRSPLPVLSLPIVAPGRLFVDRGLDREATAQVARGTDA